MSSELGRFLQTDPIGFKGDASNLYRYCHNDPEDFSDPMGLIADWTWSHLMWEQGNSPFRFDDLYQAYVNAGASGGGGGGGQSGGVSGNAAAERGKSSTLAMAFIGDSCGTADVNANDNSTKTTSRILVLGGKLVWDKFVGKWVLQPSNVSLDANIREAKTMSTTPWIKAVNQHGKWDYKDQGPYRDFGNINYGATGRAQGYSDKTLLIMGHAYKMFHGTDTPKETARDQRMIRIGIDYFDRDFGN